MRGCRDSTCSLWRTPRRSRWRHLKEAVARGKPALEQAPGRTCGPVERGAHARAGLLAGLVDPVGDPMLEQFAPEGLHPMEETTLEQFMKDCSPWERLTLEQFVKDCLLDDNKIKKQDAPALCDLHCCKDGPIRNGLIGQKPPSINPERLKDFGEEDYLNGDVKTWEMKIVSRNEELLRDALSRIPQSSSRTSLSSSNKLIRFEDISAAAFKIQCGVQKTPCMVRPHDTISVLQYSRLSKQYGMDIYLKKEFLQYTGSVKERGVLYLLTSLPQDQQRKGVIVASDSNFSMAVAYHASELRIPVFVIMSTSTSPARVKTCREYGAMVISYGTTAKDSQTHARRLAQENGYLYLEEEEDILVSMLRLLEYERATVDAEGAIGLAALVAGKLPELKGKRVAIVICSGNLELRLLQQCIARALTLDNRVCRFSLVLSDSPGDISKLLEILAREEARVLDIKQERTFVTSELFTVEVTCTVETRDKIHTAQLRNALLERYPTATWTER
ncbi:L-threonine dehydratase catabolic TdcB-like [Grus japonensis]|uniref:L-serine deaminase n=1 Tax=Grus japonensis TaxID=30415 RepID=A0ABC9X3T9_GRUJA